MDFFPSFLAAWKSDFSVPPFSKRRQSQESYVVHAPPCLWRGRRVSRHEPSGTVVSTRLLRTYFIAVRRFLVARSDGRFGSYLATYVLCSLERQKGRTHVHRSPTFLVKVGLIPPRDGHVSDSTDHPLQRGLKCEQSSSGLTPNSPFHCGLASLVTQCISLAKGAGARAEQFGTYPQQPFSLWLS